LFIPNPDPEFLPILDPGGKKASDPGSGSATLVIIMNTLYCNLIIRKMYRISVLQKVWTLKPDLE
jgi:hypothetical protein